MVFYIVLIGVHTEIFRLGVGIGLIGRRIRLNPFRYAVCRRRDFVGNLAIVFFHVRVDMRADENGFGGEPRPFDFVELVIVSECLDCIGFLFAATRTNSLLSAGFGTRCIGNGYPISERMVFFRKNDIGDFFVFIVKVFQTNGTLLMPFLSVVLAIGGNFVLPRTVLMRTRPDDNFGCFARFGFSGCLVTDVIRSVRQALDRRLGNGDPILSVGTVFHRGIDTGNGSVVVFTIGTIGLADNGCGYFIVGDFGGFRTRQNAAMDTVGYGNVNLVAFVGIGKHVKVIGCSAYHRRTSIPGINLGRIVHVAVLHFKVEILSDLGGSADFNASRNIVFTAARSSFVGDFGGFRTR